jgi:hypothetical protein
MTGFGQKSVLFRALEAMLATYTNPNSHYQMENDLTAITWDPKGVGPTKVTWYTFILEYEACVTETAHLDLPLLVFVSVRTNKRHHHHHQMLRFTWKEGWFAVFKTHIPLWATKMIMDKPSDFNTMASFWSTLLRYEPRKLPLHLHALAEVEIETVPWKEATLQALYDGNFRMAQLCMQADGQEEEIPCNTTSYIHAMSQGAPLLARNSKPISCWTCVGNHLRQNCPKIAGGNCVDSRGGGARSTTSVRQRRPRSYTGQDSSRLVLHMSHPSSPRDRLRSGVHLSRPCLPRSTSFSTWVLRRVSTSWPSCQQRCHSWLQVIQGQMGISRWAPRSWPMGHQLSCGRPKGR